MFFFPPFSVILDANVIYPAPVRDLLLNLAYVELFSPKWTDTIQHEWISNLLKNRPDLNRDSLEKIVHAMNAAFPDANVFGFEDYLLELELPDTDDRHVLAAALKCEADAIITFNQKDFPIDYLMQFEVVTYTPDSFLRLLYQFSPDTVQQAFRNQLKSLKNLPQTKEELINTLVRYNIPSAKEILM